ncbi:MAG: hypothetical protein Q8L53_12350 [Aestuariivirga sp.]|nr:hypothetical protein [Aestuariivirga sp.]
MSDGPHKSLPMRKGWKKFAEHADKAAFELEQVADAAIPALEGDWWEDVAPSIDALRKIVGDTRQFSLFGNISMEAIEALKQNNPGNSLLCAVVDGVVRAVASGQTNEEALLSGAIAALIDRGARAIRQVEEHYLRKAGANRAYDMRTRMEDGISRAPVEALGRRMLGFDPRIAPLKPQKLQGLDDGVRL